MRTYFNLGFFATLCLVLASCTSSAQKKDSLPRRPITVMSFNIRYATPNDGVNRWNNRKERVAAFITFYHPDFLGTQEVLYRQLEDMEQTLPDYKHIGVGRKDGEKGGEFSVLFYNTNRFDLIENTAKTIWLSKTPEKPSKSWDAALPRIVTFGKFKDLQSGKTVWVFNTHFDHRGETARQKSAQIIIETIKKVSNNEPVILMGDFNITEKMPPYQILTSPDSPLKDTFYATDLPPIGPLLTFEGFEVNGNTTRETYRIDYIFVNDGLTVQKYATLPTYRKGYHLSDHLPIMAVVAFANK